MGIILFFVFSLVWFLPVWFRQRKVGLVKSTPVLIALAIGTVPATIALVSLQSLLALVYRFFGIEEGTLLHSILQAFLSYAVVEEFVKYFCGKLLLNRQMEFKKIDCILLLGAVGLGYEIIETLMFSSGDSISIYIRGIFIAHVMYQFIMASYYFEYRAAKQEGNEKRAKIQLFLAFLVPILLHGTNDLLTTFFAEGETEEAQLINGTVVVLLIALNAAGLIAGLIKAHKSVKDERVITKEIKETPTQS